MRGFSGLLKILEIDEIDTEDTIDRNIWKGAVKVLPKHPNLFSKKKDVNPDK